MKEFVADIADLLWHHSVIFVLIFVALCTGISMYLFYDFSHEFYYTDTDCYTRALRIINWFEDFHWHETIFPYFNPPHGFILHFTRINDIIWALFTLPLLLYLPLQNAVFYGGLIFSPFFQALTIITVLWALKGYIPPLKNKKIIYLIAMFLCYAYLQRVTNCFHFTRPDHHSLMSFIFAVNLAVLFRSFIRANENEMLLSGIASGIGLWASSAIEGLVLVFVILLVLNFNWLFYNKPLRSIVFYTMGLFIATTVAWLINPPYDGYTVLDLNRLSMIHSLLTTLIFIAYLCLSHFTLSSSKNKIIALFSAAISVFAIMLISFGSDTLFSSIYDKQVLEYFIPRISEMKPLYLSLFQCWSILIGFFVVAFLLYLSKAKQLYIIDMAILYVITAVISLCVCRFFPYYIVYFMFPSSICLFLLFAASEKNIKYKIITFIYILIPIYYLASFHDVPFKPILPQFKGNVLTNIFNGPYLYFTQKIDSLGAPYHTDTEGIIDNHILWFSDEEDDIKKLLQKHDIQYLYLERYDDFEYYVKPEQNTDKLYGKVLSGKNLYEWMEKIEDTLYKVNYTKF